MTASPKIQRWVDLVAALLSHRSLLTFEQISREVPGYGGETDASTKRTFERDKLELRAFGVPIESVGEEGSEEIAYRLTPKSFYLPYLAMLGERGLARPRRVDKYGYRALAELTFEADELAAVAEAAARARQLGDPALVAEVESAMRKLAFDLPIDAAGGRDGDVVLAQPRARPSAAVLQKLSAALLARKRVAMDYQSMGSTAGERTVEPYGLCFLNGHWYLVARDVAKDALRNYRVSRIGNVRANASSPLTPDYAIPPDFKLREHARSKRAWELGDSAAIDAVVEIVDLPTGATRAAASLGARVAGHPSRRRFSVRRPDAFVRWVMSFAGEMRVVSPSELADAVRVEAERTLSIYGAKA